MEILKPFTFRVNPARTQERGEKMAKYTITFSCGHTELRELYGPHKERNRKIEYFKEQGLCSECYKEHLKREKEQRRELKAKEEAKLPLVCMISCLDKLGKSNKIQWLLWFDGNVINNEKTIKSLGYKNELIAIEAPCECVTMVQPGIFGYFWQKTFTKEEGIEEEKESIREVFPDVVFKEYEYSQKIYEEAQNKSNVFREIQGRMDAIPKPEKPEILDRGYWNEKVYGTERKYTIYLNDEKVRISDEEAKALKQYAKEKVAYEELIGILKEADSLERYDKLYRMVQKKRESEERKQAALDSLVKPELPDFVDGKYWNKRIYGTDGKYNIYLDNKRVNISNEEAEKLEGYLAAVDAYDKKVRELKERF